MKYFLAFLILMSVVGTGEIVVRPTIRQDHPAAAAARSIRGRWRVKFNLSGIGEKNLIFDSQGEGSGSFLPLDTGVDGKPEAHALPAVWSQTTNNRLSVSGEVELPLGTCCREIGTLILKGEFNSNDVIAGKAIFITSTEDDENFNGFRSTVGTFTATRAPGKD
jgi:hypothetical protein